VKYRAGCSSVSKVAETDIIWRNKRVFSKLHARPSACSGVPEQIRAECACFASSQELDTLPLFLSLCLSLDNCDVITIA
jgi:hypothetical protein